MDELPEQLKQQIQENDIVLEDGKYPYYTVVHSLDQQSFQAYAEQIGVNAEDFVNRDTPLAIVIDQITYEDATAGKLIETKSIETKVGHTIDLFTMSYGDMENEQPLWELVSTVQIGALTDQVPMGIHTVSLGGVNIIVSEDTMDQFAIASGEVNPYVYLNSSDPMATQEAIEDREDTNVHVYNVYQQRQHEEQIDFSHVRLHLWVHHAHFLDFDRQYL